MGRIPEEVVSEIRARWRELYPNDKKTGIICPICGSGSGSKGTGITENPRVEGNLHCWKCGFGGDVIDLICKERNLDFGEAARYAAGMLGIPIVVEREEDASARRTSKPKERTSKLPVQGARPAQISKSDDFAAWTSALQVDGSPGAEYLARRGISFGTAVRMGVGYAAEWRSPVAVSKGKTVPPSPRIIFPTGSEAYATRDIRPDSVLDENSRKYTKQKHGKSGVFNADVLWEKSETPIVVCEGPMDALSAAEAGYAALAVCGTSGRTALTNILKKSPTERLLLLALDADAAGRAASDKLLKELGDLGIPVQQCDSEVYLGTKDLNEALCTDRDLFCSALAASVDAAQQRQQEQRRRKIQEYRDTLSNQAYVAGFDARVLQRGEIPTGFQSLDNLLGGGLFPGLYIIGAISSLGKTTFCLQLMDQIAASGHDVMIFSLEMGRDELIAKSLSRITHLLDNKSWNGVPENALTTLGILSGTRRSLYTDRQHQLYNEAFNIYRDTMANNLYVFESLGDIGAAQIREIVGTHISITGRKPVVLVDYLQILAPANERATDKQNTDRAVFSLKAMSRDFSIPVLGISSFNRENYSAPVSQASFKESGAIEYSSDILMGLQHNGMDLMPGEKESNRTERIMDMREYNKCQLEQGAPIGIQLKVLKNRNGELGSTVFDFNPRYNVFE